MKPHVRQSSLLLPILATGLFWLIGTADAQVTRIELSERSVVAGGRSFGSVGPYESLQGTAYFEFDPGHPANAAIVDLDLAPRNKRGRVEAQGDLVVLQPVVSGKGSGTALVEVSNRGRKASLLYFNTAPDSADISSTKAMGDGFLMRRGLTLIWVGWQFDVPEDTGRLRLRVPRIPGIQGWARSDWTVDSAQSRLELGHRGHLPYPVVDPTGDMHQLTERDGRLASRRMISRDQWRFSDDGRAIERDGGFFVPGRIYELVYRARDPAVVGLGLAAIRDILSHARYNDSSPFPVDRGFAFGVSQTGRFLRQFLYQGFNTDEEGREVFEGFLIHTAGAGRGSFNHRFGQPSRDAHRYSAFFFPTDLYPFSGRPQSDPMTGRREGLLDHLQASGQNPMIMYTNTGYEYWGRAASLLHTTLDGTADVEPLPNVRIYHLASCQHFPVSFSARHLQPIARTAGFHGNPVDFLLIERALIAAMQEWIEAGEPPPPSTYPKIAEHRLVPLERLDFPTIPGVALPRVIHEAYRADYGPRFLDQSIVDQQPPIVGTAFPSLVSQVDADGNEIAGVRPIEIQVPLATYVPWQLRRGLAGGNGELTDFWGSLFPFEATLEARRQKRDPRPSVAERYASRGNYLSQVEGAARAAIRDRFLLQEDLPRVMARARVLWDWVTTR